MRRQHTHVPFHNLNLSVATANTGTVSGAGRYHKRHTVSVSATPASHYHFVSWSDSGAATHNVTMGGSDISLTATFAIDRYSVSVSSNNTDMGTVSGGATYDYGASVSLSASPKSHYHFVNWTEGGTAKSTANPYTFTLGDSNRTFVGNFAIDQHTLTVNANNSSYGTVTGSGTYNYGTSVEVDATPSSHYHFVSWSDGGAKKHNVTVDSNKTVTATFAIDTHTISVGADTGGSATGGGEYNYGSTATLTATASTGYHFVKWSDNNTSASRTITVTGDAAYTAYFAKNSYKVTANTSSSTMGSVTGGGTYKYQDSVSLTATANSKYHFVNWTEGSTAVSTSSTYTFTLGASDRTFVGNFDANTYNIAVAVASGQSTWGSVSGSGTVVDSGTSGGTTRTITATANSGYRFVKWNDGDTNASRTVSATGLANGATVTYTATFVQRYTITLSSNDSSHCTLNGGATYDNGATATISCSPATGYHFNYWTNPDGTTTYTNSRTITVTGNATYTANVSINTYTVSVAISPANTGSVSGTGTYNYGSTASLTATGETGYHFSKWDDETTTNPKTFTVTTDVAVVAKFELNTYTISVSVASGCAGMGTVSGSNTYTHGDSVTITATPSTHYHFVKWSDNNTSATRTFTATSNVTLTATFAIDQHTLTVNANNSSYGTVTGGGTYDYGSSVEISASPADHYHFDSWSDGGAKKHDVVITGNMTVTAKFVIDQHTITGNVASASSGRGTVSGSGSYNYGSSATLTATPYSGYSFSGWTDGNSSNPRTVTVSGDATYSATFSVNSYTLTLASSSTTMGSVSGGGTKSYGSSVTATATANSKYHFTKWTDTDSGTQQSTNASYSFTMPANNVGLTANFEANAYTIAVAVESGQSSWGSVSGGGTVVDSGTSGGTSATIKATPAAGYHFLNWQDGNTSAQRSVSATGLANGATVTYTATFIKYWTISPLVTVEQSVRGTVSGGGDINEGSKTTISATAYSGYRFLYWTYPNNQTTSTENPLEITSSSTTAGGYEAKFIARYTLTLSAGTGGSVSPSTPQVYDDGATVSITATPNSGYRFSSWSDGGAATHTVTMTSDKSLSATFKKTYEVTANSSTGGTASGGGTYDSGAQCTVTATSTDSYHYHFNGWYNSSGTLISSDSSYTFTVTGDIRLNAKFDHGYNVITHQTTGGTITGGGWYADGTDCTLDVVPASHYRFEALSGPTEIRTVPYTFTVNSDSDWAAVYQHQYYIKVISADSNAGRATGTGWYDDNKTVSISAAAYTGYRFAKWDEDGVIEENRTTVADADKTFTATFVRTYTVSVTAGSGGKVSVNNSTASTYVLQTYDTGTPVTIRAVPNSGYAFSQWSDGTTNATKTISSLTSNITLTATFAAGYTITGATNNSSYGTVSGGGTYLPNTSVTLTANATSSGAFVGWSDGVLTNPRTVTATANATYTANFEAAGGPYKVYVQNDQPYGYVVLDSTASTNVSDNVADGRTVGTQYSAGANPLSGWVVDKIRTYSSGINYVDSHSTGYSLTHPIWIGMYIVGVDNNTLVYLCNSSERTTTGSITTTSGRTYTTYGFVTARNYELVNGYFNGIVSDGFVYGIPTDETTTTVSANTKNYRMHNVSSIHHCIQYKLADGFYSVMVRPGSLGGTATGSGAYRSGATATVTASASSGYVFAGWENASGTIVSTSTSYSFAVKSNVVLTATFSQPKGKVSAIVSPSGSGTVSGTGSYDVGTTATLTAQANDGYTFSNWSNSTTDPTLTVKVKEAIEYKYTAYFTELKTKAAVSVDFKNEEGEAFINGMSFNEHRGEIFEFEIGEKVLLTVEDKEGRFYGWYIKEELLSKDAEFNYVIQEDCEILAYFGEPKK